MREQGKLYLRVVSPTGLLFAGDVAYAVFPGEEGSFAVYPRHAPIISALTAGKIAYSRDGKARDGEIAIEGGFLEVGNDIITVAAEAGQGAAETKTK